MAVIYQSINILSIIKSLAYKLNELRIILFSLTCLKLKNDNKICKSLDNDGTNSANYMKTQIMRICRVFYVAAKTTFKPYGNSYKD